MKKLKESAAVITHYYVYPYYWAREGSMRYPQPTLPESKDSEQAKALVFESLLKQGVITTKRDR